MELPEGWRLGHTKNVSPQWAEQWLEYVGRAAGDDDLKNLRYVLDDRKSWILPRTCQKFSKALQDRGKELGISVFPVVHGGSEKDWHDRLTDYPDETERDDGKPANLSSRIIGEGDAA